jgi:hypothetical protein
LRRQIAKLEFHMSGSWREERDIFSKKKSKRIYKHITREHESKHAACSTNFNFDDMGI